MLSQYYMQLFMFSVSVKVKYKQFINNRKNGGIHFSSSCLWFVQLSSMCLLYWNILTYNLPCLFNYMMQSFFDSLSENHCKLGQAFERNAFMYWKAARTGPVFSRGVKHTSISTWVHSKLWVLALNFYINCWCKKD